MKKTIAAFTAAAIAGVMMGMTTLENTRTIGTVQIMLRPSVRDMLRQVAAVRRTSTKRVAEETLSLAFEK